MYYIFHIEISIGHTNLFNTIWQQITAICFKIIFLYQASKASDISSPLPTLVFMGTALIGQRGYGDGNFHM